MNRIIANNADELFIKISREILNKGRLRAPRGLSTLELSNVLLTLNDINKGVVELPERALSKRYLEAELDWYMNGTYDSEQIGKHSDFWYKLADEQGKVHSNYGQIALRELTPANMSQFDWCVEKLKEDKNTRQAVINYNQPKHKIKDNKDFVCTMYQAFYVNEKDELDSFTSMRSNDLIYGLSYDLPWFCRLQQMVAEKTGITPGKYNHHAISLHVYKKHFKMLKDISTASYLPHLKQ